MTDPSISRVRSHHSSVSSMVRRGRANRPSKPAPDWSPARINRSSRDGPIVMWLAVGRPFGSSRSRPGETDGSVVALPVMVDVCTSARISTSYQRCGASGVARSVSSAPPAFALSMPSSRTTWAIMESPSTVMTIWGSAGLVTMTLNRSSKAEARVSPVRSTVP